jgi:hypothetical protein
MALLRRVMSAEEAYMLPDLNRMLEVEIDTLAKVIWATYGPPSPSWLYQPT